MEEITLSKANDLSIQIKSLEEKIKRCKDFPVVAVEFASASQNIEIVATNPEIIQKVCDLIVLESELKLDKLRTEFKNL